MIRVTCLALLSAGVVFAQYSSSIQGVVQDPSGAVVPNALVKFVNLGTNITGETTTNEAGFYRFNSLAPGAYDVIAEVKGFKTQILKLTLTTNQSRDLNIDLEVQASAESVSVTVEAPPIDTNETRQQLTIAQDKLRDLPLLNNSVYSLLSLAPGVVGINGTPDNFNPEYFTGMSANGRSAYGNTFNVDGMNTNSNIMNGTSNLAVNPEAIGEITIETNNFRADQGTGSSIVVNVTTKSGTNEFHGSANYWFTNQDLRARTSIPFIPGFLPFRRHNLNAALGGPIVKNKTFFFGSIEMLRSSNAVQSIETYESREFVNWARQNAANSLGTRLLSEFPVDGPAQTNVLRNVQQLIPTCGRPETLNIPCDMPLLVQGTWMRSPWRNGLQYNTRVDHYLTSKDRLFGNFIRSESSNLNPVNRSAFTNTSSRYVNALQLNWTRTISPSIINEASFSYNEVLGNDVERAPFRIPLVSIINSTGLGIGFSGTFVQNNYNWKNVVTMIRGTHNIKIGGHYFFGSGVADFPRASGGAVGNRPSFTFLNLLDLVRDTPWTGNASAHDPISGQPRPYIFGVRGDTFGFFVQDEWKVRPNLTLTMSLRWDDFGNHRTTVPTWQVSNLFLAPGATLDERFRNAAVRALPEMFPGRLTNYWSPRIGVAWTPGRSRRTVIRAGAGVYYDWITQGETSDQVNVNPPNFIFPAVGQLLPMRPVFGLGTADTFPFGFPLPTFGAGRLDERGGIVGAQTNVGGLDPGLRAPRVVNFLVGFERQLPFGMAGGVTYSGSRTTGGLIGTDFNRFPGDLMDGRLDRLNPSFGIIDWVFNFNEIRYNALIANLRKNFRDRGLIQTSYTFGRTTDFIQGGARSVSLESAVDPRQLGDRRADSAFDVRHRMSASGVYRFDTPFRENAFSRLVLGGWEIGSTLILQTGMPFSIFNGNPINPIRDAAGRVVGFGPGSGDYNLDGFNFDFPNVPANLPTLIDRHLFLGANANIPRMNAAEFTAPAVGFQGNSPRHAFRQQGLLSLDASLIKNNRLPMLGERGNLQLRLEVFNAINRVNLGGIVANLGNPNFGRIMSQPGHNGGPRQLQIGARISF
jgi:hypothetical protein